MSKWWTIRTAPANALDDKDGGNPPPKTPEQLIEELTKRVAALEKDTKVWPDEEYFFGSLFSRMYGGVEKRPKVGEGVRLLLEHLNLKFEHGAKSADKLVVKPKAKKAKK